MPSLPIDVTKVFRVKDGLSLDDEGVVLITTDDPSSVGQAAPRGSLILRQTGSRAELFQKIGDADTDWEQDPGVGATTENLTIPIDYDDGGGGSVGDPPLGTVFVRQSDVDDLLTANSWTAFKHIESVFEALPTDIFHSVLFNVAAGVHRPLPASVFGWKLIGKQLAKSGTLTIQGVSPSQYTSVHVSLENLSISSFQTGSGDPSITFSGTPLTGFDLKGRFAVMSTGQTALIWENDNSTIRVMQGLSPDPTGATVTIATPSTILRSSQDDISPNPGGGGIHLRNEVVAGVSGAFNPIILNDILYDHFGSSKDCIDQVTGNLETTRLLIDDPSSTAFGVVNRTNCSTTLISSAVIDRLPAGTTSFGGTVINFISDGLFILFNTYLQGGRRGIAIARGGDFRLFSAVIRESGLASTALASVNLENARFSALDGTLLGGTSNRIIDSQNVPSVLMQRLSTVRANIQELIFVNCAGECVRIETGSVLDLSQSTKGYKDGGGNADVGIQIDGPHASAKLNANTDVSGTNGDVRMSDGTIRTYAQVVANGPIDDPVFNIVEKV